MTATGQPGVLAVGGVTMRARWSLARMRDVELVPARAAQANLRSAYRFWE